jgi:hypothetical protein
VHIEGNIQVFVSTICLCSEVLSSLSNDKYSCKLLYMPQFITVLKLNQFCWYTVCVKYWCGYTVAEAIQSARSSEVSQTHWAKFTISKRTSWKDGYRHRCRNVGFKFVLVEQIYNAQLLQCWKQQWPRSSHLSKLCVACFGVEKMGATL